MTLLDKIYWVYKCKKPVTRAEKGSGLEGFFRNNRCIISVPEGFRKKGAITLSAVGDLIPVDGLENSKDILYENVADLIFERDISFAGLEAPLTNREIEREVFSDKGGPVESCSQGQFDVVKGHRGKRYTAMHTASNHMLDLGLEGIETTLRQLDDDGIVDVGTNREESAQGRGRIINKKGFRIGFASATFGLNGREIPEGREYIVNVAKLLPRDGEADISLLQRQISYCRAENCDMIIASLHWGYEFEFFPRKRQIEIAHTIVEWGADMIVSHHPHVVQPIEYYQTRRDKNRIAVIAYSLGSLVWSFSAPHLALSAILNLSIAKGVLRGEERTYIEGAMVIPVIRVKSDEGGSSTIRIQRLHDCLRDNKDTERMAYLKAIKGYAELVFGQVTPQ